jgi:leucyl aminopeptidase
MVPGMSLQISFGSGQPTDVAADVVVLGVWVFGGKKAPPALQAADTALGGALMALLAKDEFSGKRDQMLSVPTMGKMKATRLIVLGLGDRNVARDPEVRAFAARAARAATGERAKSLALILPDGAEARIRAVAEGAELGAYRFTKYFTGERKPKAELGAVTIFTAKKLGVTAKKDVALGQRIAAAVNISRDLSNEPSNKLMPAQLAIEAQKMAKANGLKIQVFDYKEILKRGMSLIDAVGRGSENEPRFVHMQYVPKGKSKKRLVFVGKGITFDTGGISIKPAAGMGEMKHDMSGAGNMVGLMAAVAALQPSVEVHAIMACAENMPDGKAYRPGDVWPSLDGKTVEIINTDAEGRLVLADVVWYAAQRFKPKFMIDLATLTGAIIVALGNTCSGWYATNDATANEFNAALKISGEQMWRMPLLEELKDQLKSDVADIKHTGDRFGGSISAALFLREFIGTVKNWVHADIAGPATADRASGWNPKGATGHGVLTFLALVERASSGKK